MSNTPHIRKTVQAIRGKKTRTLSPGQGVGVRYVSIVHGQVQSIQTGPPKSLTIAFRGATQGTPGIRYFSFYSPTNGDTVWTLRVGTQFLVLGTLA